MAFGIDDAITGVSDLLTTAINKIWPDPADKAKAEAVTMAAAADAAVTQLRATQAVMLAEEQSTDKWTSRARPSFLYVMYAMILMSIPMGIVSAINPALATHITAGIQAFLASIPQPMWDLFTTGYLGYVVARGADKAGGVLPMLTGKKTK